MPRRKIKFGTVTFDLCVPMGQVDVYGRDMFCVKAAVNCAGQLVTNSLFLIFIFDYHRVKFSFNLLAPELFFLLILAHSV